MEIGPVFRAVRYQKGRFWLVALEVAFTLAIAVNCIALVLDLRGKFLFETGLDEATIVTVRLDHVSPAMRDEESREAIRERDLERLRALPGVLGAAPISNIPLSGAGSSTGRRVAGSELDTLPAPYFVVGPGALEALGVDLVAGRDFTAAEYELEPESRPVLVTRALADGYFPQGDALGKIVENRNGDSRNTIVGIVDALPNSWPDWEEYRGWTMLVPGDPSSVDRSAYVLRAEPAAVDEVFAAIEPTLVEIEPGRIVTVRDLMEIKRETFSYSLALIKILGGVIVLLVLVTAIGIVGLTAFSVTQRRKQIGTRRALGATRGDVLRYFLLENWMVTGLGLALGIGLTYGLNVALSEFASAPKIDFQLVATGAFVLWATGILAALVPALRATRVAPVVATRTV